MKPTASHDEMKKTPRESRALNQSSAVRPRKEIRVECPMCEFVLKGNRFEGYRCVKCHAHYSARFIAHMKKLQLSMLIHHHFTPRSTNPAQNARDTLATAAQENHDARKKMESESEEKDTVFVVTNDTTGAAVAKHNHHRIKDDETDASKASTQMLETQELLVPDLNGKIAKSLHEAHESIHRTTQHLEDVLSITDDALKTLGASTAVVEQSIAQHDAIRKSSRRTTPEKTAKPTSAKDHDAKKKEGMQNSIEKKRPSKTLSKTHPEKKRTKRSSNKTAQKKSTLKNSRVTRTVVRTKKTKRRALLPKKSPLTAQFSKTAHATKNEKKKVEKKKTNGKPKKILKKKTMGKR